MIARRNLALYLPYRILSMEGVAHGLYLLWWVQEKHVSAPLVALMLGLGDLALLVLEVPTGVIADRYGHRFSLILGSLAQAVGTALFWLGDGVWALGLSCVIIALGDALRSGPDEALLNRSCASLGRVGDFQAIVARSNALALVALFCMVLAGGWIAQNVNWHLAWGLEVSVGLAGLGVAFALREVSGASDEVPLEAAVEGEGNRTFEYPDSPSPEFAGNSTFRNGASRGARARGASAGQWLRLVVSGAINGSVANAGGFLAQTTVSNPLEIEDLTWLVAGLVLLEAIGSALAVRVGGRIELGCLAAVGLAILAVGGMFPLLFIPAVGALALLGGLVQPILATKLQDAANDDTRATVSSIASACDMAFQMAVVPLAALGRDHLGLLNLPLLAVGLAVLLGLAGHIRLGVLPMKKRIAGGR